MIALPPPFICQVVKVHDGDTFTCADRTKVRIAGVDANEMNGTCHNACAPMSAAKARDYAAALILQHRITCQPVGKSYARVVARCTLPDGRSLSCALIAHGAATRWDRYWRRYHMGGCT